MDFFDRKKRTGGFMDEIRCDEPSYLIWKWHPAGAQLGEGNRENAIRWGSSLRVKDEKSSSLHTSRKTAPRRILLKVRSIKFLKLQTSLSLQALLGLRMRAEHHFRLRCISSTLPRSFR